MAVRRKAKLVRVEIDVATDATPAEVRLVMNKIIRDADLFTALNVRARRV